MAEPYDPNQVSTGPRSVLLDRTPVGARVLDVGCWSGFAGRYLQSSRNARVDGIEPHPEMAQRAASSYSRVVSATVEEAFAGPEFEPASYDVVLFMDVLEHLVDPKAVLEHAISLLRPGGRILASIPNSGHWSMRKELLRGRWNYMDSGLMDRTHLRFFTLDTIRELFAEASAEVVSTDYSLGQPPVIRLPEHRLGVFGRWPEMFAVQVLIEARAA